MPLDHKTELKNLATQCDLRPVKAEDKDLILEMRNQSHVRENMLSSGIIQPEDHKKWFEELIKANDKAFFIFTYNDEPAGVIGFYDLEKDTANWSFYLENPNPPKGLGTIMCSMGLNRIFGRSDISKIRTIVLDKNVKSLRLHERLGFNKIGQNANMVKLELDQNTHEEISLL
tara:strand:+ start:189 stop:707 length:519 start_codon:yes stop_codon:yes gene_type:complete